MTETPVRALGIVLFWLLSLSTAFAACGGKMITQHVTPPACIPAAPKRIVTLDPLLTLGMLRELGVTPVGAPYLGIEDREMLAEIKRSSITDIGHPLEPSLERIIALKPDLILGASYGHSGVYEKLSRIAPTLLIDHIDWKEHYRLVGEVSGKSAEATAALQAYEQRVADIRKRIPDVEVSTVRVAPGNFQVYLDGPLAYAPYLVLREAGVKRPAYERTTDGTIVKRPDWEGLGALEGDVLLYVVISDYEAGSDDRFDQEIVANPLWQMLPAVQAGRAYRVDRGTWMGFHGITSANRVLDDIERYIIKAP